MFSGWLALEHSVQGINESIELNVSNHPIFKISTQQPQSTEVILSA